MDLITWKTLHVIGALALFLGFGALLAMGENRTHINRLVSSLHGAGLLILFLTGFAILGVAKYGFKGWVITKIVLWVVMALLFVFTKKDKIPAKITVFVSLLLGAVITWLCMAKPF